MLNYWFLWSKVRLIYTLYRSFYSKCKSLHVARNDCTFYQNETQNDHKKGFYIHNKLEIEHSNMIVFHNKMQIDDNEPYLIMTTCTSFITTFNLSITTCKLYLTTCLQIEPAIFSYLSCSVAFKVPFSFILNKN